MSLCFKVQGSIHFEITLISIFLIQGERADISIGGEYNLKSRHFLLFIASPKIQICFIRSKKSERYLLNILKNILILCFEVQDTIHFEIFFIKTFSIEEEGTYRFIGGKYNLMVISVISLIRKHNVIQGDILKNRHGLPTWCWSVAMWSCCFHC